MRSWCKDLVIIIIIIIITITITITIIKTPPNFVICEVGVKIW